MTKKDAVSTITDSEYKIMAPESSKVMSVIKDNSAGAPISRFDLDKLTIPQSGATSWQVAEPTGVVSMPEVEAIIVKAHNTRAFWLDSKSMGSPPDCSSNDGVNGYGEPGGFCLDCPNSQWKSDENELGQACKIMRTMYLLRPDSYLPTVLNVPPTSYRNIHKFFTSLSSRGKHYSEYVVGLKLESTQSQGGFKYSRIIPTVKRELTDDEKAVIENYIKTFAESIEQKVDASEFAG